MLYDFVAVTIFFDSFAAHHGLRVSRFVRLIYFARFHRCALLASRDGFFLVTELHQVWIQSG